MVGSDITARARAARGARIAGEVGTGGPSVKLLRIMNDELAPRLAALGLLTAALERRTGLDEALAAPSPACWP
jgi:hypothetical protein